MTRYILIDTYSGYIWDDRETETPIDAAKAIDREAKLPVDDMTYDECYSDNATYEALTVPANFPEIEDGQDMDMINRVHDEGSHVCYIAVSGPES
jgi:hypothetical protein